MSPLHTGAAARTGACLSSIRDWQLLIDGAIDAIVLSGFASSSECQRLVAFITDHPATVHYTTAPGILRLGTSFSDVRKSGLIQECYSKPDVLQEALCACEAIPRMIGVVAASWPRGIETYVQDDRPLHRLIGRRIVGTGAEAHDDDIAKDLPDSLAARQVRMQIGVNLYVETPQDGGELEGWRRRLTSDDYERLRLPSSYGVDRAALGAPDWTIKPEEGDLILFNNSQLHAIRTSARARTTCGFFLGYRGSDQPLFIWS